MSGPAGTEPESGVRSAAGAVFDSDLLSGLAADLHCRSGGRFTAFRPGQAQAIASLLQSSGPACGPLLLVQRTGWGKSLVYFATTLALRQQGGGPALIISPLLSLIRDQCRAAAAFGLEAVSLNSENRDSWDAVALALAADRVDLLLLSPESLAGADRLRPWLGSALARCSLLVIDEVHCLSEWGHDFRPDFSRIRTMAEAHLPADIPRLACTATANNRVLEDVTRQFGGPCRIQRGPLDRPSLSLSVLPPQSRPERMAWLADHLNDLPGHGIIYAQTRRDCEMLAGFLAGQGHPVAAYHARLSAPDQRAALETALQTNQLKALVATSALGLGFDKPDLGFVAHFQAPGAVLHYYQQVGRAGRALPHAIGVLLHGPEDESLQDYFIHASRPPLARLQALVDVVEDAESGLDVETIAGILDLSADDVQRLLKLLSLPADAPVVCNGTLWLPTHRPFRPDLSRLDAHCAARQQDWEQMKAFLQGRSCLMRQLTRALDDPETAPCGRCSVCRGKLFWPVRPRRSSLKAALAADPTPVWQRYRPEPPLWLQWLRALSGKRG